MEKRKRTYPKVSIVIPVYNGEKYIKYAIDSALAQTYENLEIIVVNDGSTDNTDAIVQSYGDKVRYIKKKNGGVSSALNLAIRNMKGDYFSWLSHDDTYEPNKVEREIEFLTQNNYIGKKVIVFSDYYLIDKKGKKIADAIKDHEETVAKPEYNLLKGHINGLTLLIPKAAFDEYGYFDEELFCTQDFDMWWRMMKTYSFIHIPEILVSTRWHKGQTTHTNPKVEIEGNAFYKRMIDDISKERMIELEGSEYNFLMEIANFHRSSVYVEFSKWCEEKAKRIFDEAKQKTKEKKVSVIIPFYNRSSKTVRAVRSVLKQTHKNLEILLINDGSNEDVSEVEKLVKKYENIKLIKTGKNNGASSARNKGIEVASGDYISFLDSDDEFVEDKIQLQLQYAVAANGKLLHTSYIKEENGRKDVVKSGKVSGHCERELMYSCPIATPTVMIESKWLKERGARFNTKIEIGEDTCFWLELMKGNTYLVGINQPLSIVHVGKNAAAYSDSKQVIGLKAIIRYLINDDYYSCFDLELSRLMESYVSYAKKIDNEAEVYIEGNMVQKLAFFLRQEGLAPTLKRVGTKIRNTIFSKS